MGNIVLGEREYSVTDQEDKIVFKDLSNRKIKINFSFSKDKEANRKAEEGLRIFWTEVYRGYF